MRASIVVKNTCHTVEVLRKMATDSHWEIQRVLGSRGAGTPSSSESIVDSQEEYIYGAHGLSHFSRIIKNGPTDPRKNKDCYMIFRVAGFMNSVV